MTQCVPLHQKEGPSRTHLGVLVEAAVTDRNTIQSRKGYIPSRDVTGVHGEKERKKKKKKKKEKKGQKDEEQNETVLRAWLLCIRCFNQIVEVFVAAHWFEMC